MAEGPIRHLGEGYEPHVDELDGRLSYGLPIESGFVGYSLEFEIGPHDLRVLKADPYRRAALHHAVHTVMQTRAPRLETDRRQALFRRVADDILHTDAAGLKATIAELNRRHNIVLEVYIDAELGLRPWPR